MTSQPQITRIPTNDVLGLGVENVPPRWIDVLHLPLGHVAQYEVPAGAHRLIMASPAGFFVRPDVVPIFGSPEQPAPVPELDGRGAMYGTRFDWIVDGDPPVKVLTFTNTMGMYDQRVAPITISVFGRSEA